jgi:hypothetical protein
MRTCTADPLGLKRCLLGSIPRAAEPWLEELLAALGRETMLQQPFREGVARDLPGARRTPNDDGQLVELSAVFGRGGAP